jgi:hypothetical protein
MNIITRTYKVLSKEEWIVALDDELEVVVQVDFRSESELVEALDKVKRRSCFRTLFGGGKQPRSHELRGLRNSLRTSTVHNLDCMNSGDMYDLHGDRLSWAWTCTSVVTKIHYVPKSAERCTFEGLPVPYLMMCQFLNVSA